ncbi:MAG: hypothetical protein IJT34_08430 [Butyrivibrio sp.]|nr:hypothetical protein [Butyrivibrio sp.]
MRLSSVHLIPICFLVTILLGASLLMLPAASVSGASAGPVTALFTATTVLLVVMEKKDLEKMAVRESASSQRS